jgi:hypothetical protein
MKGRIKLVPRNNFLFLFLILLLTFVFPPNMFSGEATTSKGLMPKTCLVLRSDTKKAREGDKVTITVMIKNVINLYGAAFDIVYDPEFLRYHGCEEGEFLKGWFKKTNFMAGLENDKEGRLVVGVSRIGQSKGASGRGVLATVFLEVISEEQGKTGISLDKITLKTSRLQYIQLAETTDVLIKIN